MGDCLLHFRIDSSLVCGSGREGDHNNGGSSSNSSSNSNNDKLSVTNSLVSFSKIFSADTAIREVMDLTTTTSFTPKLSFLDIGKSSRNNNKNNSTNICSMQSLLQGRMARLWDCTVHPPRDVTDWPLSTYSAIKGSKSKTLYDAGWYPSGTLLFLPIGQTPKVAESFQEADIEYNVQRKQQEKDDSTTTINSSQEVAKNHEISSRLKPSQVLQVARTRFDNDNENNNVNNTKNISTGQQPTAAETSKSQRLARERREANRKRRLEACLKRLDPGAALGDGGGSGSGSKNQNVSAQVRRMLIKSRATGRTNLAVPDRVYLHCIFISDDDDENNNDNQNDNNNAKQQRQEFCYFSRQDTIGRILDFFRISDPKAQKGSGTSKQKQMEFLINAATGSSSVEGQQQESYGRLPSLMRLYEAVECGYLNQDGNRIIIRVYNPETENPTPAAERPVEKNDPSTRLDPPEQGDDDDKSASASFEENQAALHIETAQTIVRTNHTLDPSPSQHVDPPDGPNVPNEKEEEDLQPALSTDTTESLRTMPSLEPSGSKEEGNDADLELATNAPTVVNPRLMRAIRMAQQQQQSSQNYPKQLRKSSGKATAAARKVREMQIKSKAIGDAKRIKLPAQRFYFEAIVVTRDVHGFTVHSRQPHFLALTDKTSRLVRDYYATFFYTSSGNRLLVERWDYLILPASAAENVDDDDDDDEKRMLQRILDPTNETFKDLQARSMLRPFDILILIARS